MLESSDLEINLLEFRQKSFQFARFADLADEEYAVFERTETETESQLRPKLVHLHVFAPRAWIVYDAELDLLRLARDGATLAARIPGTAMESAAEPSEFSEQGIDWSRVETATHAFAYYPRERAAAFSAPEGLAELRA